MSQTRTGLQVLESMIWEFIKAHDTCWEGIISERMFTSSPEGVWKSFSAESLAGAKGAANIFLRHIERGLEMALIPGHEIEGWMQQLGDALSKGMQDSSELIAHGVQQVMLRVGKDRIEIGYVSQLAAV